MRFSSFMLDLAGRAILAAIAVGLGGCASAAGERSPAFASSTPINPFYTTEVVFCPADFQALAAGKPISKAGAYGDAASSNMHERAANIGIGGLLESGDACSEMPALLEGDAFGMTTKLNGFVKRFADMTRAKGTATQAVLVPVVLASDPMCTVDGAYGAHSTLVADFGTTTCWERHVQVGLLLFGADGKLWWRSTRGHGYTAPGGPNQDIGMDPQVVDVFNDLAEVARSSPRM